MFRRRTAVWKARLALALPVLLGGCAALLDLPDPILDEQATGNRDAGPLLGDEGTSVGDGGSQTDGTPTSEAATDADTCQIGTPANCGACGVDCTHGVCKNGICTLAPALLASQSLVVRNDEVWVTEWYPPAVLRCAANGCGTDGGITAWEGDADSEGHPFNLRLDEAGAPWMSLYASCGTDAPEDGVYRLSLDGGSAQRVTVGITSCGTYGFTVTQSDLLWAQYGASYEDGGGYTCPLGNCSSASVKRANVTPYGSDVVATPYGYVWLTADDVILCDAPDCSTKRTVIATGQYYTDRVVADGTQVYWSAFSGDVAGIYSADLTKTSGGPQTPTELALTSHLSRGLLVKNGMLYWTDPGTDPMTPSSPETKDGRVRKCQPSNCSGTTVDIATGEASPYGLAADDRAVYWVNHGLVIQNGFRGDLKKAPL